MIIMNSDDLVLLRTSMVERVALHSGINFVDGQAPDNSTTSQTIVYGESKRTQIALAYPLKGVAASPAGGAAKSSAPNLVRSRLERGWARSLSLEDRTAVHGCVVALFTLLEIYGLEGWKSNPSVDRAFSRTVTHWSAGSNVAGGWMKFVKWKLAAFFYSHTQQMDLPPPAPWSEERFVDLPHTLCAGCVGRFAARLVLNTELYDSFMASILQVKKGCPRPSKELCAEGLAKSVAALTTVHKSPLEVRFPRTLVPWGDIVDQVDLAYELTRESVEQQLERSVDELFPPEESKYENGDRYRVIFPSSSASVVDSRSVGGALRSIRRFASAKGLTSSVGEAEATGRIRFRSGLAEERIGLGRGEVDVDVTELEHAARELYKLMVPAALEQPSTVKAVPLAESLKVRVITKGEPLSSKVLHPLQKFIWGKLHRHPTFKLIGTPVTALLLQGRLGAKLGDDEYYLSGDYSAATDNLAPWASNCIARRIARNCQLTPEETALFLRSLTENEFILPDGTRRRQQWGQLMGSIVSFPVLCIANAALCRWSIEVDQGKKVLLSQSTLLINGDDVVFRSTVRGHKLWEQITDFVGLSSSLGKTFLSRQFAQINSVNFQRLAVPTMVLGDRGKQRSLWFKETPYVNLGLLFGLKRSGEKLGVDAIADSDVTLGERCRALIAAAPFDLRERVMRVFLKHHAKVLGECHVPWFVPEAYGGVGLPIVARLSDFADYEPGDKLVPTWGPSTLDLKVAHRLLENPRHKVSGKPLYPVSKVPGNAPSDVHKLVLSRLPVPLSYGSPSKREERLWQAIYGKLCFDVFLTDLRLTSQKDSKRGLAVLRRNESSWQRALRAGNLPPPLSLQTLHDNTPPQPYLPIGLLTELHPLAPVVPLKTAVPEDNLWSYVDEFELLAEW